MISSIFRVSFGAGVVIALAACAGDAGDATDSAALRDSAAASASAPDTVPTRITTIAGFKTPESVRHDADLDLYFVSNISGNPSNKDRDGYIATVRPDGTGSTILVQGGAAGVTLHAPKGMTIVGDTLWVTDIDVVRAFNKRDGKPIRSVDLTSMGATFLNDIAVGPDDALYITDTGIRIAADGSMTTPGRFRIFRIAGTSVSVAVEGRALGNPNGIAWDQANERFVLAPFGEPGVLTWKIGDTAPMPLVTGAGQFDGVEVLPDGRVLVSSWADSAVHVITNGRMRKLVSGIAAPADIGYDVRRDRVLIPLFNANTVEVWSVGRP